MIGAEPHPPYDRPPLSKKLMMGELDSTSLDTDAAALRLDLRLGEAATGLAGQGGAQRERRVPVRPPDRGDGRAPVPAARRRPAACPAHRGRRPGHPGPRCGRGPGWPSSGPAGSARNSPPRPRPAAAHVTVLEAAARPPPRPWAEVAAATMVPWYAEAGVDLRLGQPVESVAGRRPGPARRRLAGGRPGRDRGRGPARHRLAGRLRGGPGRRRAGRQPLRTSVPGVYAAGDCAVLLVRPLRPAAAGGALGHRPALAHG